jgi:hypothetical protein
MKFFEISGCHGNTVQMDETGIANVFDENIAVRIFNDSDMAAHATIIRVPSSKNPANRFSLPADYQMTDILNMPRLKMKSLAHELGIDKPAFNCSGPRKNLKHGDLYIINRVQVNGKYREKGYEEMFLDKVFKQIQALKRDPHPVLVASPKLMRWYCPGTADDHVQLLLNAGFNPVRKGSEWYYLSE